MPVQPAAGAGAAGGRGAELRLHLGQRAGAAHRVQLLVGAGAGAGHDRGGDVVIELSGHAWAGAQRVEDIAAVAGGHCGRFVDVPDHVLILHHLML